ncbi:MAG: hypothetical protein AAF518_17705 [Spirochaetota bacterium]
MPRLDSKPLLLLCVFLSFCWSSPKIKPPVKDRLVSYTVLQAGTTDIFYEGRYISKDVYLQKNQKDLLSYHRSIEQIFQMKFKAATQSRFQLIHKCSKARERKLLRWAQVFFEQIYPLYFKYEASYNFRLVYFKNRKELQKATKMNAYGFYLLGDRQNPYHLTKRTLYSYCNSGIGTLWHELIHAFVDINVPVAPPDWFGEGLASFYEEASLRRGRVIEGYTNWRMPALISAMRKKKTYPLSKFLRGYYFYQVHSYPQARFLFCYLWMKGWMQEFTKQFLYEILPKYDRLSLGDKAIALLEKIAKQDIEIMNLEYEKLARKYPRPQKLYRLQ